MGKINNCLNHYLRNKRRFADLYNGIYFRGNQLILPDNLTDSSENYEESEGDKPETSKRGKRLPRMDFLHDKNNTENNYADWSEKSCGIKKTDRLTPVTTLCLYHGEDIWDGPRTLLDMMQLSNVDHPICSLFADYPFRLYCIQLLFVAAIFAATLVASRLRHQQSET